MSDNEEPKNPNPSRRRGRRGGKRRKKEITADAGSAQPAESTTQTEQTKERPPKERPPSSKPRNPAGRTNNEGQSANKKPSQGGRPQKTGQGQHPPRNQERPQANSGRNRRGRGRSRDQEREDPIQPTPSYMEYVSGELFDNEVGAQLILVEANPEGEVNTQMMIQFRGKYPELYAEYITACQDGAFQPGNLTVLQARDGVHVALACTHKDKYLTLASVSQLDGMFKVLREYTHEHTIETITMPPVAGGLGLLNWPNSRQQLDRAFKGWLGKIFIVVKAEKVERTN